MKKITQKLAPAVLMMAWCTYYFSQVSRQKPESQMMIRPVYYVLCVLFLIIAVSEIKRSRAERKEDARENTADKVSKDFKGMFIFVIGTGLYLFLLPYAGFIIATLVFLLAAFLYLKSSRRMAVILSVLLTAFVYVAFKILLGVPLPAGFLGI